MPEVATGGSIHITKLMAAQRQLRAAIRMFFAAEDDLAVHTVAAAAYRLLADLKKARGRDEVGDFYLTAPFYSVRDFRRGTLPSHIANNPDMMAWIREVADKLPIDADTEFDDVKVSVSAKSAQQYWQNRNAVSNFLKHADRDREAQIAVEDIDNLDLLAQALSAHSDLAPHDELGAEGFVLCLYHSVTHGMEERLIEPQQPVAARIKALKPNERLNFCSGLVSYLNKAAGT